MSAATECCAPCQPVVTNVPGVQGDTGAAGADGADGISAFTLLTSDLTIPALAGDPASLAVLENSWAAIGQTILASDGVDVATFTVTGLTGSTIITGNWVDAPGDSAAGNVVGSGGKVVVSGEPGALAAALPNAIVDNSTGTASDTIAAGVGVFTLALQVDLATLTAAASELLTDYVLGYAFKILSVDFVVSEVGAGAGATMTINLEIGAANVTGGVVNPTLANTATQGAIVAGTAVTAANVGTAANALSVEVAAGGTIFTAGEGSLLIKIQNMDSASAVASLSDHVNDLIVALT